MKTKTAILVVIIAVLLISCGAKTTVHKSEVATEIINTKAPITQEPILTDLPTTTKTPINAPIKPSLACVILLNPENGVELLPTGIVTFSWTLMNEGRSYVLHIISPSGDTSSFETDKAILDRYLEAFVAGGEYQWQVVARGADGNDICVSEIYTFDKPAYEKPNSNSEDGGNDGNGSDDEGNDEGDDGSDEDPGEGSVDSG